MARIKKVARFATVNCPEKGLYPILNDGYWTDFATKEPADLQFCILGSALCIGI
jgi:hypothetical protein